MKRKKAQDVGEGLKQAGESLLGGIEKGITGLII